MQTSFHRLMKVEHVLAPTSLFTKKIVQTSVMIGRLIQKASQFVFRGIWQRTHQDPRKAEIANTTMNCLRVAFFFSATSILMYLFYNEQEDIAEEKSKLGLPVIIDHSQTHKRLRESGVEHEVIYQTSFAKGFHKIEYNRAEYLKQLEDEALERAIEAQKKLIAEKKEIPSDVIKLV